MNKCEMCDKYFKMGEASERAKTRVTPQWEKDLYFNAGVKKSFVEFKRIQSMCGHPDAAEACRLIIKHISEILK